MPDLIDRLIKREGGLSDHPADRGGLTKYGVTQAAWSSYIGRSARRDEIVNLTIEQARTFYQDRFLTGLQIGKIGNEELKEHVLDLAVNHGNGIKIVQRALKVSDDGVIGPITLHALTGPPRAIHKAIIRKRCEYYAGLVQTDFSQAVFLKGWLRRGLSFMDLL